MKPEQCFLFLKRTSLDLFALTGELSIAEVQWFLRTHVMLCGHGFGQSGRNSGGPLLIQGKRTNAGLII